RFCDWATSASISCFEASASIVNVTLMSLKPFRTSVSAPRMPRMSWFPSTVDSTERSWMPRFCATEATPAVRQLARPPSRDSIGVVPLSGAADTSGWSASKTNSVLWLLSSPSPEKVWIEVVVGTPLSQRDDARQVNWAASGAPVRTSLASSSACTLTPLSIVDIASHSPCRKLAFENEGTETIYGSRAMTTTDRPAPGSVGTVVTRYLELPQP